MNVGLAEFLIDAERNAEQTLGRAQASSHRTGELFIELLEGNLKTTASSPIDYL
jgi:hypothetical protein